MITESQFRHALRANLDAATQQHLRDHPEHTAQVTPGEPAHPDRGHPRQSRLRLPAVGVAAAVATVVGWVGIHQLADQPSPGTQAATTASPIPVTPIKPANVPADAVGSWNLGILGDRMQTVNSVAMTIYSDAAVVIDIAGCGSVTGDLVDEEGVMVLRPRSAAPTCTQSAEPGTLAPVSWPDLEPFLTPPGGLKLTTQNLREQLVTTNGQRRAKWVNQGARSGLYMNRRRPDDPSLSAVVPDVLGLESQDAEQRVVDAGLPVVTFMISPSPVCEVPSVSDGTSQTDQILAATPAVGDPLPQGQTVVLFTRTCLVLTTIP